MRPPTSMVRPPAERPTLVRVVWRVVVVTVATALTLWLLAAVLDGFTIDTVWQALLAGFVIGLVNSVLWPALAVVVVPISVLTLGLGAILLDIILVGLVLDALPGVDVAGWWTATAIVVGLAAVTTLVSAALALDD